MHLAHVSYMTSAGFESSELIRHWSENFAYSAKIIKTNAVNPGGKCIEFSQKFA